MSEWKKIEHKRYFSSNANKRTPGQSDFEQHDEATREPLSATIGSLIGAPVIRHNDSDNKLSGTGHVRFMNQERKGGLLYIRPSDISGLGMNRDESVNRKQDVFESQKELWPTLENTSIEETIVAHSPNTASWSNVVKAPPRPLPFLKVVSPSLFQHCFTHCFDNAAKGTLAQRS